MSGKRRYPFARRLYPFVLSLSKDFGPRYPFVLSIVEGGFGPRSPGACLP